MNTTIYQKICDYLPCSKDYETGTKNQQTCSVSCGGFLREQKRRELEKKIGKRGYPQDAINHFLTGKL